ncbi:hypothetical protein N7450_005499 [Penicillium hetheringtonii]|uniref:Uncharacterized protein n=1 Tax=Penicillium hetheringtonii TaxID=911720 RepID=A0AAD6GSE0_9EURO|nr:hypothetical protein N7450_005499 [Penicillium hetheringtonii]
MIERQIALLLNDMLVLVLGGFIPYSLLASKVFQTVNELSHLLVVIPIAWSALQSSGLSVLLVCNMLRPMSY